MPSRRALPEPDPLTRPLKRTRQAASATTTTTSAQMPSTIVVATPTNPPTNPPPAPSYTDAATSLTSPTPSADALLASIGRLVDQRLAPLFATIPSASSAPCPTASPSPASSTEPLHSATLPSGTTPYALLQSYVPWVDDTTITQIISRSFDVNHLIKLIPPEDRPRGAANTSLPAGLTFQLDTPGRPLITTEQTVTSYEKTYPTFSVFLQALSVYAAIRGFYDLEHNGLALAMWLHLRKLSSWVSQGFPWRNVLSYAIAHFRSYQSSTVPLVWLRTDTELYTAHVTRPMLSSFAAGTSTSDSTARHPICRNWNFRSCTLTLCRFQHKCAQCHGDHPAQKCPYRTPSAPVNAPSPSGRVASSSATSSSVAAR